VDVSPTTVFFDPAGRRSVPEYTARGPGAAGVSGLAADFLVTQAGIGQFPDIGTGLPSANNTHQVAQKAALASWVV
jgi:hypothetical protein